MCQNTFGKKPTHAEFYLHGDLSGFVLASRYVQGRPCARLVKFKTEAFCCTANVIKWS